MIERIFAIAMTTVREAIRNRILYAIAVLVFGVMMFALVLGEMSLNEQARVARDVGLGAVSFFGGVAAIVLGVLLLYNELQRRTIHTIVSKPLHRFEFVLGKYAGMAITLSLLVLAFTLALTLLLALQSVPFDAAVVKAMVLSYVEVLVVAAIAVFFSSFSGPFLAAVFSLAIWFLGRITPELQEAIATTKSAAIRHTCEAAMWVAPDMHLFRASGSKVAGEQVTVHSDFVEWSYVAVATGYGLLYIAILLGIAIAIFSRRDFV